MYVFTWLFQTQYHFEPLITAFLVTAEIKGLESQWCNFQVMKIAHVLVIICLLALKDDLSNKEIQEERKMEISSHRQTMHWSHSRLQKDSVCMWQLCAGYMVFALQWVVWVSTKTHSYTQAEDSGVLQRGCVCSRFPQKASLFWAVFVFAAWMCPWATGSLCFVFCHILSASLKGWFMSGIFPLMHSMSALPDRLAGSLTHSLYDVKRRWLKRPLDILDLTQSLSLSHSSRTNLVKQNHVLAWFKIAKTFKSKSRTVKVLPTGACTFHSSAVHTDILHTCPGSISLH